MDSEDRVREYRITIRTDGLISISRVRKDQVLTFPSAGTLPLLFLYSFTNRCYPIMQLTRLDVPKFL